MPVSDSTDTVMGEPPISSTTTAESYRIVGKCLTLLAIIFFKSFKPTLCSATFLFEINTIYELGTDKEVNNSTHLFSDDLMAASKSPHTYMLPSDVFATNTAAIKQSPWMKGIKTRSS